MENLAISNIEYKWFNRLTHILLCIFFFFLPFNYALTLQVGFPLKISEIALGLVSLIYVSLFFTNTKYFKEQVSNPLLQKVLKVLILFLLIAVASFIVNQLWSYSYNLKDFGYRFGTTVNSGLKTSYLIVVSITCLVSSYAFIKNHKYYLNILCWGAAIAALYGWYLFIFSLYEFPVYLLPGMDEWPQHGLFSFGHFIRCGTFKEGNYTGLFLLISAISAFYIKRYVLAVFLVFCIIPTVSSMAFAGIFLYIFLFSSIYLIRKKNFIILLLVYVSIATSIYGLSQHKDFAFLFSKFTYNNEEKYEDANNSRKERINLISIAYNIGMDNPFLGIGLANYSAHLPYYNESEIYNKKDFKYIPNNVYFEIFSELGFFGFIVFAYLLFILGKNALKDRSGKLLSGYLLILFYFIAFPTFSVLFIWVYFGLLLSISNEKNYSDY